MSSEPALRRFTGRLTEVPAVKRWREARFGRRFFTHTSLMKNLYLGVFDTFAEALASVPVQRMTGYDNAASADLYRERTRRIFINDYPSLFWLSKMFDAGGHSVFDLGGHIGLAYYAYQRYLRYPQNLRWCVRDVAAVNEAGREWAGEHDLRRQLSFTDQPADADGVDILFAAGSLQYLDYTLADMLRPLQQLPRYLLLNSVPIHINTSYFTVQNMGTACCPYRVTAEREFVDGLKALGYVMQDRWENADRACLVPFHPELSLDRYFGYCFTLGSQPASILAPAGG